MVSRRDFLGVTLGAGAALALTPELLRALRQSGGTLIQRGIPSSGEMLPAVGLSFSNHALCADPAALREVLRTFADNGARVFDAMHGDGIAEQLHATFANELGIQNKLFWSTRGSPPGGGGPPQPGIASVAEHVGMWRAKLKAPRMDLVMLPAAAHPAHLAALKEEKQAGRVRYIGVQTISAKFQSAQLETLMRDEPIDFVGVDYDAGNRHVEGTILPLAQERKIGVLAFFPFGNNGGVSCGSGANLFGRVGSRPLPGWAAEFDATTWAHFFLKYVVSHPAVTVARVGTTKAHHMVDNIGGGVGRLPDQATRERMAAFIDALPPVAVPRARSGRPPLLSATILDSYVGKYNTADGSTVTVRRYGSRLVAKVGPNPDAVLRSVSANRFWLPGSGAGFIDFQPDGTGTVNGLIYGPGSQKIPASRVR
jgi:aryl-alcohol dehydrogenase-like predicted oxidoreductase